MTLVVGASATARASAPRLEVRWTAPESCARERFVDALQRHLADSALTSVQVSARIDEQDGMWRIETSLGAEGRAPRRFAGRSCEAVVDAASLATAIAIDPLHVDDDDDADDDDDDEPTAVPDALVPEPESPPDVIDAGVTTTTTTTTRAPTAERPTTARAPRRARTPRHRTRAVGWAAATIDGGALPGVGLGPSIGLGVVHGPVRGELVGAWRAPVRVRAPEDRRVGAAIDLLHVGARACGVVRPVAPIELPWCGGIDVGRLRGRGFGLEDERTARLWWAAVTASTGVHWLVTARFALFVRVEGVLPLRRHAFAIAGLPTLDRVSSVAGRGLLGVEVRLP